MGSGRSYDNPITEDGCSWNYRFGELDGRIWSSTSGSGATWHQNTPSGSFNFVSQSAKMFGVTSSDEVQITVGGTEYRFIATSSLNTPDDVSPIFYFSTGSTTANFGSNLITEINSLVAEKMLNEGDISGGMIPKVNTCLDAVNNGVTGVVIVDGRTPHSILFEIFSDKGAGTLIRK